MQNLSGFIINFRAAICEICALEAIYAVQNGYPHSISLALVRSMGIFDGRNYSFEPLTDLRRSLIPRSI